MAYVKCSHLTIGYDGREVARDLNFEVNKGDYLCIVGENGTGKSTLLKTLLHLNHPLGGTMEMGEGLRAFEIGYLPQQTMVQKDFPATVWEIVLSGTLSRGKKKLFYGKAEKELARKQMEKMDVWEMRKKCYRHLSGGQQQRVLLARALCAAEKVILLDEPVTGLDPKITAEFYQLTEELHKEGIAIIMVSHDQQAISYATHVLHLKKKHMFFGTKEEYMASENWKMFEYLGGEKEE